MISFVGESGHEWSYDPLTPLGEPGGFGQVFRGFSEDGRPVAVKTVELRSGGVGERRRREREIEIGEQLKGKATRHLVVPLDFGRKDDDLLLVMPLAEHSLATLLDSGRMTQSAGIDALLQINAGLVELADNGVLHRDLKPANILFLDGRWCLADFGISRSLNARTDTYTFRGFGTIPYMAPELWTGQSATTKSDLYSLGIIAYEVLTGAPPFDGCSDEAEWRRLHREEAPPIPSMLPAGVSQLMIRLLAKDPAERPQNAHAVKDSIEAALRRLGPEQERLRSAGHDWIVAQIQRRSASAAMVAAEIQENRLVQILADLNEIIEVAALLAKESQPETKLIRDDRWSWRIQWHEFILLLTCWPPDDEGSETSGASGSASFLLSGSVISAYGNRIIRLGNLLCEQEGNRPKWSVLRYFKRSGDSSYSLGPVEQHHGLRKLEFLQERASSPSSQEAREWAVKASPLTPEQIVSLLAEAIEHSEL